MGTALFGRAAYVALSLCVSGILSFGPAAHPVPRARPTLRRAAPAARPAPQALAVSPVLRLQEELAQLGYLPVAWDGQSFYYPEATVPAPLLAMFAPGQQTPLVTGALETFEEDHGLPISPAAGPAVFKALAADIAAGRSAPQAYAYAFVDTQLPERITIWSPAGILTQSFANTGTPGATTAPGTYPVYLRLTFQVMRGKNLSGTPYADPVHWIDYFNGGDAVHGFYRAAYGFPQSLGCVEVPLSAAQRIYDELQIGSLVTVASQPFSLSPAPGPLLAAGLAETAQRAPQPGR